MRVRILTVGLITAVVLSLIPGRGGAQSDGRGCSTSSSGYVYTITTPDGDSRQHDIDLYFNNDRSGFIVLVFDDEGDVRLATSSGLQAADRFVHGSLRLYPDETYRIAVACVSVDADYRLSVKRGEEINLSEPRSLGVHAGLTANQAVTALGLEAVMLDEKRRLQR